MADHPRSDRRRRAGLSGRSAGDGWQTSDGPDADGHDGVPVALSGGWEGGRLVVEMLFLETPHRLTVSCDADDATFTATWGTVPLRAGTLQDLRKPD